MAALLVTTLLMTPITLEAKGFGTETTETTREMGAGQCHTVTVKRFKLFWVTVSKTVTHNINACEK